MKRILLSLLVVNALQSADVVTVDPAGTVIIAGTVPATPAAGEVRIGAGEVKAQGMVTAGDVVVNRTATASGNQVVRGDDPRMTNARVAAGGDSATVQGRAPGTVNGLATLGGDGKILADQIPQGGIVAFVRFAGPNAAIASSKGIQSVVRNGVGTYTITLAPGLVSDSNYAVICSVSHAFGVTRSVNAGLAAAPTATSFNVDCGYGTTTYDPTFYSIIVVR